MLQHGRPLGLFTLRLGKWEWFALPATMPAPRRLTFPL